MTRIALDTSVAIPLLVSTHRAHSNVSSWARGQRLSLSGHALVETYSVLTRLPGDVRVEPSDAARLLGSRFEAPLLLGARVAGRLPEVLAELKVSGGAVYDALVALAAVEQNTPLATRDGRARTTYEAVGARVVVVA